MYSFFFFFFLLAHGRKSKTQFAGFGASGTAVICTPADTVLTVSTDKQLWRKHHAYPGGSRIAQWLSTGLKIKRLQVQVLAGSVGEFFFSKVNFLCGILFWYLFHPCVTAVACKRSRSFCQKCRWLGTAKHTCTLHIYMWLCMK